MNVQDDRLGSFLVERKRYLNPGQYTAAAAAASAAGGSSVLQLLVSQRVLTPEQAYEAVAFERGWSYFNLEAADELPPELVSRLEPSAAREMNVVPVGIKDNGHVIVAMENPGDLTTVKRIQGIIGAPVSPVFAPAADLAGAVTRYYSTAVEASSLGQRAAAGMKQAANRAGSLAIGDGEVEGEMVRILKVIVDGAIDVNASDIHIEPGRDRLYIRYTVDGKLHHEPGQPLDIARNLTGLIKVRAKLQSAELRPQNGVMNHPYKGRNIELRVAIMPAAYGESITLRVGGGSVKPLSSIGFTPERESEWRNVLAQPSGLILTVGPMGCGKTSLNYSSLDVLMQENRKIISLEKPVEMKIPQGITQVEINPDQRVDWSDGMSTALRMGASVLNIGEINEPTIANTVIEAALSGHLVLSTLHTNDAPGAVLRLREMGIRPSVLADTLRAVCSQRLPRVLCSCKVRVTPTAQQIRDFALSEEILASTEWFGPGPEGCAQCRGIGYRGRTPIHELMTFGGEVHQLIADDAPNRLVAEAARRNGMRSLREDGVLKARAGVTSLAELRSHIVIY